MAGEMFSEDIQIFSGNILMSDNGHSNVFGEHLNVR